jgi:hypothetical protein
MRINVDRICELAGIPGARRTRGGLMREGVGADHDQKEGTMDEMSDDDHGHSAAEGMKYEMMDGMYEEDEEDGGTNELDDHDPMEEIVEIDEADLVKELRRMKVQLHESRKRERARKEKLQEAQLKAIIDQEVKNVLKELNLNSGWMYGKKKPTRSRRGYTHQGSYLKGIGFK